MAMKTQIIITLSLVEYGQNKNYLHFNCTSSFDSFKNYYITFCGTDLNTDMPLVDEDKEALVQMLKKDYGYAPFKISQAKETLKNKFQYSIET